MRLYTAGTFSYEFIYLQKNYLLKQLLKRLQWMKDPIPLTFLVYLPQLAERK